MRKYIIVLILLLGITFADNILGIYVDETTPMLATSVKGPVNRCTSSMNINFLWGMFGLGNAGLNQAMTNSNMTEIMYVDRHIRGWFWGLMSTQETIVYGK